MAGTFLAGLIIVFGIRAISKHYSQTATVGQEATPAVDQRATPADSLIRQAIYATIREPDSPKSYNLLAAAYMQKTRETADFSYNAKAEAALKRSFEVAPDNHAGVSLNAYLLLSYHRFNEALDVARHAVEQSPRDYEAYGALVDALVETGNYPEARVRIQQMLDLRPYTASYARASYLRSLYGNTDGAIEAMRLAAESSSPADPEGMAWCYVHLGDELTNAGKLAEAEYNYDHALFVFPDYHLALAAKARARLAAGDTNAAIDFYKRALDRVPLPDTAIALGDLYQKLGRTDEAKKQYDLVEFIERTTVAGSTYSRQLALFYANHDMKLDDGLSIAQSERAKRSDIFTCDALAWCLYKKGDLAGAKKSIDEAMRLGTRDARISYHAGMINQALGNRRDAAKYLQLALKINPFFNVLQADVARQTLHNIDA
ncbi:MAG: tetratricopeptide repeat protein [Pyrinomonadaceae bacterium]